MTANAGKLAQVVADIVEERAILDRTRAATIGVQYVDELLAKIQSAAEPFTTWRSEKEAMLKSGLAERTLRRRFRELLDSGLARYRPGTREREYLDCAVPNRPNVAAAFDAGRHGGGSHVAVMP